MLSRRFCRLLAIASSLAAGLSCLSCGRTNHFEVVMEPEDGMVGRRLTVWQDRPRDKLFDPNEGQVAPAILRALGERYPRRVTADPNAARQTFAGRFGGRLPGELGGAGEYRVIHTLMGSAGVYVERFAGIGDLVGPLERISLAADTVTDALDGWLASHLKDRPGLDKLRAFMDTDFRRDAKNLAIYLWSAKSGLVSSGANKQEIYARVGLYLIEHDYIHFDHAFEFARQMTDPAVSAADKAKAPLLIVRRFLARKMGIDETHEALGFLSDPNEVGESFEKFIRTSEAVGRGVERWRKLSDSMPADQSGSFVATSHLAAAKARPDAAEAMGDMLGVLVNIDFEDFFPILSIFRPSRDEVSVKLKLPAEPLISNGDWDKKSRGLTWSFGNRPKPLSAICYAVWASPDSGFQRKHFGRVVLDGEKLALYCGWRKGLSPAEAAKWDEFLKTVRPAKVEGQLSDFCGKHTVQTEPATPWPDDDPSMHEVHDGSYFSIGAGIIVEAMNREGSRGRSGSCPLLPG